MGRFSGLGEEQSKALIFQEDKKYLILKMLYYKNFYRKKIIFKKGITLVELLIVIVIVGILAAIAIPSYTNYMVRTRRADAKTALEQFRAAQEMRRAERGSYATDITELQNTWGISTRAGDYNILFVNSGTTGYIVEARPFTSRQMSDGSLFIDNLGRKWDSDGKFFPEGKWAK